MHNYECKNEVLKTLLNKIINELPQCKDNNKHLDTPLFVGALYQDFCREDSEKTYHELIEDLREYSDYDIIFRDFGEDDFYNDQGITLVIILYEHEKHEDYNEYQPLDRSYEIILSIEDEYLGYCDCKPGDKDYREDKKCCGHGCDWAVPYFRIIKRTEMNFQRWKGDQHDFWDFEDAFYEKYLSEKQRKEKIEKEEEITRLKSELNEIKKKLNSLQAE